MGRRGWNGPGGYTGYPTYPKARPRPVEGGVKVASRRGAIGEQWWSQRWVQALERFANPRRLERGRKYARQGQVAELEVTVRGAVAKVQGTRPQPYEVRIRLSGLTDREWAKVMQALAERASFAASLLAGEVPQDIEEAFKEAGQSLFPLGEDDLATDCTCPDWENPCKHVAAVHYVLAEAFDADPFLLFLLRGRTREQVLADLRDRRAAHAPAPTAPPAESAAASLDTRPFWTPAHGAVGIEVRVQAPAAEAGLLAALGPPPGWSSAQVGAGALEEAYRRASAWALRAAMDGAEEVPVHRGSAQPPASGVPPRPPPQASEAVPLGPRRVHASGRIMVRSRFFEVGREHAGRDVQVFDHGGRLRVAFPDGAELWLRP